ncbi:MAG: dihydropteroate synthase [Verrucomicrobiota bacterium]
MIWQCGSFRFDLAKQGEIMGILNVTPDSFSDGGRYASVDLAVEQAAKLVEEGAAIIDIGGESTRPGADDVPVKEEADRVIPVIRELAGAFPKTCLSVDTSKWQVAEEAIKAGAHIINDVTGFSDSKMITVTAESTAGAVCMHMQGRPRTMQQSPRYDNVVAEVEAFFERKLDELSQAGISTERIALDPGIGFGKTLEHNIELLKNLDRLQAAAQRPLLLGVSRKSLIAKLIKSEDLADRSGPTVGITAMAVEKGIKLHRVHEALPNLHALRMMEAMTPSIG